MSTAIVFCLFLFSTLPSFLLIMEGYAEKNIALGIRYFFLFILTCFITIYLTHTFRLLFAMSAPLMFALFILFSKRQKTKRQN